MSKTKPFKAYPSRRLTMSDQAWEELKAAKLKSGKTWTKFILELLSIKK